MLRINLLRHLPAPEAREPKAPRRSAWKPVLGLLLALALVAAAVWVFRHPEWRPTLPKIAEILPKKKAPAAPAPAAPGIAPVDSARLELEARAMREIAAHQADAARLARAFDSLLSGANKTPSSVTFTRAALTTPDGFVLRGQAASTAAFGRLKALLEADSGLVLKSGESRPREGARGIEFIFSGTLAPAADTPDSLQPVAPATPPALPADPAALGRAWAAFLEDAAGAGVELTMLPSGAPSASGILQAHPYRVTAKCSPRELREFVESAAVRSSPFGIRRMTWENEGAARMVSLDIMAFSPR